MSDTTVPQVEKKREGYSAHWWQIHAWGVGGITDYFMWEQFYLIMNIHTTVFKVSAPVVGWILAAPRIVDGILDPILGHWSDNMRSRWGRRKPFLLVAGILGAVFAGGMFSMSPDWPQWLKCAMVALFAIGLFVSVGTFDMAHTALGYELSEDYAGRLRVPAILSVYKSLGGILGGFVVGIATGLPGIGNFLFGKPGNTWQFQWSWPDRWWKLWEFHPSLAFPHPDVTWLPSWTHLRPLLIGADGKPNEVIGFRTVSIFVACIMLVALIFPLRWTKERYDVKVNRQHVDLFKSFKSTLGNWPFVTMLLIQFAGGAGSVSRNLFFYIGVYYVCYGDKGNYSNWKGGGTAIVGFLLALLVWPMVRPITKIIGKRAAIIGTAALGLVQVCGYPFIATPGNIYGWFIYDNLFLIPSMILGTAAAGIMADICDIDELKHGERREGMFTAVYSFMSKMQMSLVMPATGTFLWWAGFQEGVTKQPDQVLHRLVTLGFKPLIVISAITLIVSCFFPITAKTMEKVRADLDARHEAAGILKPETTEGGAT